MTTALAIELAERGIVPLADLRWGVRRLLTQRLRDAAEGPDVEAFARTLVEGAIAVSTDEANEPHYEVPAELFQIVLGHRLKYSGAYWPEGVDTLDAAEDAMLALTCRRAGLENGQDVLELGRGASPSTSPAASSRTR